MSARRVVLCRTAAAFALASSSFGSSRVVFIWVTIWLNGYLSIHRNQLENRIVRKRTVSLSLFRRFYKCHRIERAYGSFVRTFTLPDDADSDKVNAEFRDGVLKVQLAKSEAAKPKQIEVKVA